MQRVKIFCQVIVTVLWEKWVEFKFEWIKITTAALISPLLYMIALGWGLGATSSVTDRPYIDFLVPGIIALTTMNTSLSAVAQPLNVQRIFERSFDQLIISPTPMPAYIQRRPHTLALHTFWGGNSSEHVFFHGDAAQWPRLQRVRCDSGHCCQDTWRHCPFFYLCHSADDIFVQHIFSVGPCAGLGGSTNLHPASDAHKQLFARVSLWRHTQFSEHGCSGGICHHIYDYCECSRCTT